MLTKINYYCPRRLFVWVCVFAQEYTHPLLKYYRMHGRIPPLTFFTTYLCEIVFFWRAILFTFTVGYKLFLSLAAYYIMNRYTVRAAVVQGYGSRSKNDTAVAGPAFDKILLFALLILL